MSTLLSTARRNALLVLPLAIVNMAGYLFLNHHPLSAPRLLPVTAVDQAIPFLVWTVWPYALLLLSDVLLPLLVRDAALFRRMVTAYAIAIALNFFIWALFPTTLIRPLLPAQGAGSEGWSLAAYRLLVSVDPAGNCFPSGHITIPTVGVWAVGRQWPRARGWAVGALLVLSLSILTTQQHYAVDLLGGLATAAAGILASGWLGSARGQRQQRLDQRV